MPSRLELPMLSVDAGKMRNVDTRSAENLFSMWSVFSKCADSVEDGQRLANLSWRIWNRETLCNASLASSKYPKRSIPLDVTRSTPMKRDIPALSSSVESAASNNEDESEDHQNRSSVPFESCKPSGFRSRDQWITSLDLEKMVVSIQDSQELEPLSQSIAEAIPTILSSSDITPRPKSPTVHALYHSSESSTSTAPITSPESGHSGTQTIGSDTSAELITSHSVVRGFSPNQISSSYRSSTPVPPTSTNHNTFLSAKAKGSKPSGMHFMLGGSSGSSGEDGSSLEENMSSQGKQSFLTEGLKRSQTTGKQLSFKDEVESRTLNHRSHEDEEVFESSEEEEDDDDDAVESDSDEGDDEEWEDDASQDGDNPSAAPTFQRVDSKPNLVSRKSLLTDLMNQSDRAAAFANIASKSSPALRRLRTSASNSSSAEQNSSLLGPQLTMSKPITQGPPKSTAMALSPRTTRREMLHNELTCSLRKDVLWERQQKKSTINAVMKRRHTAHNLSNLKEYPEAGGQDPNHWYSKGLGAYHEEGW